MGGRLRSFQGLASQGNKLLVGHELAEDTEQEFGLRGGLVQVMNLK